jgi:hypothetical protein
MKHVSVCFVGPFEIQVIPVVVFSKIRILATVGFFITNG